MRVESSVDADKLNELGRRFAAHEHWVQNGCREDAFPGEQGVPAYLLLAEQDGEAYGVYRHALVRYLGEAEGCGHLYRELEALVRDNERAYPREMQRFWHSLTPLVRPFKLQWHNLFQLRLPQGLTHEACFGYQHKYEVELFLVALAWLRGVRTGDGLDVRLAKHRDTAGRLRKALLVRYILEGLRPYPTLGGFVKKGYQAHLRNAVGHNTYRIAGGEIRSLDGKTRLTSARFFSAYWHLQELQNAILWLLAADQAPDRRLAWCGVLSIGFVPGEPDSTPVLGAFQLAPFRALDPAANWLTHVAFTVQDGALRTALGGVTRHEGSLDPQVHSFLASAKKAGKVKCELCPMMPCVHVAPHALVTPWGEFCQHGASTEVEAVVSVEGA